MSASPSPLPKTSIEACRGGQLCPPKGPLYQEGAGRAKRGLGEKPRRSGKAPLFIEGGKIANGDQGGEENSPVMLRMTTPSS